MTLNVRTVNVILLECVNHRIRSESVFDKLSEEEMSEVLCAKYHVRSEQKKTRGEREGEKLTTETT